MRDAERMTERNIYTMYSAFSMLARPPRASRSSTCPFLGSSSSVTTLMLITGGGADEDVGTCSKKEWEGGER